MGRDKAQLPLGSQTMGNQTMLELQLARLRALGFRPAVAGLAEGGSCSAPVVEDGFEQAGPLGGIEAALRSLAGEPEQPVLLLAVDLPLLAPALLRLLWQRAAVTGAKVTMPFLSGRPQPLCAVYRSGLAGGIAAALVRGERKVMHVVQALAPGAAFDGFRIEALAPLAGWSSPGRWFTNVNTPAEYRALCLKQTGSCIYQGEETR